MGSLRLSRVIHVSALVLLVTVSNAHAEVYRYVKDGQVFYGDRMPGSTHQSGHSVLNNQGVVFKEVLSRDEQRQKVRALEEKEQREFRDRALLNTFGSEDDLVVARNRRLALLDIQIAQVDGRAESLSVRVVDLKERIKVQEAGAGNEQATSHLQVDLTHARAKLNSTLVVLNDKMIERNNMATQFVFDMTRYRELKAQR